MESRSGETMIFMIVFLTLLTLPVLLLGDIFSPDNSTPKVEQKQEVVEEPVIDTEELYSTFDTFLDSLIELFGFLMIAIAILFLVVLCIYIVISLIFAITETSMYTSWIESKKLERKIKKNNLSDSLSEYIVFIYKNSDKLPEIISSNSEELFDYIFSTEIEKDSLSYASGVFLEPYFINSYSKLLAMLSDETYFESFKKGYGNPTALEKETIYEPILGTLGNFKKALTEYENLIEQTNENSKNLLLKQDFNNIK